MKPKKTTAPSDSRRDSQNLILKELHALLTKNYKQETPFYLQGSSDLLDFIQQQIDKSHQAGFQEAVEQMREANRKEFAEVLVEQDADKTADAMYASRVMVRLLSSLKPTQSQGSEGKKKKCYAHPSELEGSVCKYCGEII